VYARDEARQIAANIAKLLARFALPNAWPTRRSLFTW